MRNVPPETVTIGGQSNQPEIPDRWRKALLSLGLAWLTIMALFRNDWAAMAGQWWNSSTYNHILFVPAIFVWLIWQRWPEVTRSEPRVSVWGLAPLALALLGWVLGSFAAFDLVRQSAVVAMLPATALIVLGPRAFVSVLFPMFYLIFLVPFGDELVPPLQMITAKLTIALTQLSGIPAVINGVFIDTPAGLFEVAEACSGVKFLVAMVALGALVANIGFRSWRRRALFMGLCVVVPILANGVRAWGTIYAAQYIGADRAAGIDHLIYGWIFFAVVIAAVIGLSWRFFDRSLGEPAIDINAILQAAWLSRWETPAVQAKVVVALAAVLTIAGLGWSHAALGLNATMPPRIYLPEVAGWKRVDYAPQYPWQPSASGADHRLLGSYADPNGQRVDLFYAIYAGQGEGREAAGFGQGAFVPGGDWSWSGAGPHTGLGKSELLVYRGSGERLAVTWYRNGDVLTGSNIRLKLAIIADRLALRSQHTAVLVISAERSNGQNPERAVDSFVKSVGPLGAWMDRIGEGR